MSRNASVEKDERNVSPVHVFSLKIGTANGLWQYKASGTHERVMMHGLRKILDETCLMLGLNTSDRSAVYLFSFSDEPFQRWQVCLEKIRESDDGGCFYRVKTSRVGDFAARGRFPAIVNISYLRTWPGLIYFTLERSLTGGIVS